MVFKSRVVEIEGLWGSGYVDFSSIRIDQSFEILYLFFKQQVRFLIFVLFSERESKLGLGLCFLVIFQYGEIRLGLS